MSKRYIFLSCLLYTVLCNWTQPLLIQTNGSSYESGLHLSSSGEMFAFYSKKDSICYKIIKDNHISAETCLAQDIPITDVAVVSTNKGTGIFIAFTAKRTSTGKVCNTNDTTGCTDIFYIESKDLGKTWSKAQPVPRKDPSDAVNRLSPKLLYISENDQVSIYYCISGEDINYIYKVDRPKDSSAFTPEKEVYKNRYPMQQLKVEYINVWDTITVFVGVENLYWLKVLYSDDDGTKWNGPIALNFVSDTFSYVMTKPVSADNIFIAVMDRQLTLYVIDNEGTLVSTSFHQMGRWTGYKPFVAAFPDDGLRYIVSAELRYKNMSTYIYNVGQTLLTNLRITNPSCPFDKTVLVKDSMYRISVLHNDTNNLYLSTLNIPIEGITSS